MPEADREGYVWAGGDLMSSVSVTLLERPLLWCEEVTHRACLRPRPQGVSELEIKPKAACQEAF